MGSCPHGCPCADRIEEAAEKTPSWVKSRLGATIRGKRMGCVRFDKSAGSVLPIHVVYCIHSLQKVWFRGLINVSNLYDLASLA